MQPLPPLRRTPAPLRALLPVARPSAHGLAWAAIALLAAALPLPAAAQAPIYRCGSSYSQAPCSGGHAIDDKLSTLHGSTAAAPGQTTVYLCQGPGGGQFWSASHCQQHSATIDRMESVPASLPWAQQVQQAQQQWYAARRYSAAPHDPARADSARHRASEARARAHEARTEQQAAQHDRQHTAACSALRARMARLDSQGRTGSTPAEMERLRHERREAREAYRAQGC